MGIKLTITNTEAITEKGGVSNTNEEEMKNEDIIKLTDHTLLKYHIRLDDMGKNHEFLSGEVRGIELIGNVDIYDKSNEIIDVNNLSLWAKTTSHEKGVYRDIICEVSDSNNVVYDYLHVKKAFIVDYNEKLQGKKDVGEFYVLIRWIDNVEELIKE